MLLFLLLPLLPLLLASPLDPLACLASCRTSSSLCSSLCSSTLPRAKEELKDPLTDHPQGRNLHQKPVGKIVGGVEAAHGTYPFLASLKIKTPSRRYLHFCGGAAITTTAILTAAHCVATVRVGSLFVSLGDFDVSKKGAHERVIKVVRIIRHPDFQAKDFRNDIAVLRLEHPFRPHLLRQVVPLIREEGVLEELEERGEARHLPLTVMGWGSLSQGSDSAKKLHHVTVPFLDKSVCMDAMVPYHLLPGMLCAGHLQGGRDACQGDSGGPLVYNRDQLEALRAKAAAATTTSPAVSANASSEFELENTEEAESASIWGSWVPWNMDVSWWDQRQLARPRAAARIGIKARLSGVLSSIWNFLGKTLDFTLDLLSVLLQPAEPKGQAEDPVGNLDYSNEDEDEEVGGHAWGLVGLVSWGVGCARPGRAGVYTDVAHYRDWIDEQL